MSAGGTGRTGQETSNMPNGAAAHAPLPATALERHHRRLLRCYPPSHRGAHREEMIILAAPEDKAREIAESDPLVRGGARYVVRRWNRTFCDRTVRI